VILWRISNYADLSGTGGVLHPGRWHHRGRPIVYLAESPAAALLEVLVHVQASHPSELPVNYQLLELALPDAVRSEDVALREMPDWRSNVAATRNCGDAWLAQGRSLLLRVPSAVVGRSFNRLFNPLHPQALQAQVVSIGRYPFDERLFGGPA
jgi:RES domain-containing protein